MIELDEKDIKAVGRSRFLRKTNKSFSFISIGFLLIFFALLGLVWDVQTPVGLLPPVSLLGLLGYYIWYFRRLGKAEKALLKQWEEGKGVK